VLSVRYLSFVHSTCNAMTIKSSTYDLRYRDTGVRVVEILLLVSWWILQLIVSACLHSLFSLLFETTVTIYMYR
jgi:hypothetical protein